jgi:branched-chain amino acid transport system permease protein
MNLLQELKHSTIAAVWFMFLTFPIMVIKVNTVTKTIEWRWLNMAFIGIAFFFLSALWRYLLKRKEKNTGKIGANKKLSVVRKRLAEKRFFIPVMILLAIATLAFPYTFSMYQTTIMISALIYVMLGLGLNIVIGLAGLLDLGYVAFFAVGLDGAAPGRAPGSCDGHYPGISRASPERRLSGHCDPGLWGNHSPGA